MNKLNNNTPKYVIVPRDEFIKLLERFMLSNYEHLIDMIMDLNVTDCETNDFLPIQISHKITKIDNSFPYISEKVKKFTSYLSSLEIISGTLLLDIKKRITHCEFSKFSFEFLFRNNYDYVVKISVNDLNAMLKLIAIHYTECTDTNVYNFQLEYYFPDINSRKKISFSPYDKNTKKLLFEIFSDKLENNTSKISNDIQKLKEYNLFAILEKNDKFYINLKFFSVSEDVINIKFYLNAWNVK